MKIKIILLFCSIITLLACDKENVAEGQLSINLNGIWILNHIHPGGFLPIIVGSIPNIKWEINGNQLIVNAPQNSEILGLNSGTYQLSIKRGENEFRYLFVDEISLGAISFGDNQFNILNIDTGYQPNSAISHAPSYTFLKEK